LPRRKGVGSRFNATLASTAVTVSGGEFGGTGTLTIASTQFADGSRFTVGSQMWEIDYNASAGGLNFTNSYQPSSSFVTVTAVPEPSTYVMLAIAGGIAAVAARRRRKA